MGKHVECSKCKGLGYVPGNSVPKIICSKCEGCKKIDIGWPQCKICRHMRLFQGSIGGHTYCNATAGIDHDIFDENNGNCEYFQAGRFNGGWPDAMEELILPGLAILIVGGIFGGFLLLSLLF